MTIQDLIFFNKNLRIESSFITFNKRSSEFLRPTTISVFNFHKPKAIELVARLCLELNHSREHKFKHSFKDSLNRLCFCGLNL